MANALRFGLSFGAVGDRLVFMDTTADRYFLLPEEKEAEFRSVGEHDEPPREILSLFAPREAHGPENQAWPPVPSSSTPVARDALDWSGSDNAPIRTGRAVLSRFTTEQRLRLQKLPILLRRLERKVVGLTGDAWNAPIASQIVRSFQEARIWRHARDRCLSESIALFEQLATRGCRAKLVFGVSLKPFAAHSWVQWGETVLNDHRDHARGYAPVFVL